MLLASTSAVNAAGSKGASVKNISPKNKSTVAITNKTVADYWVNFRPNSGYGFAVRAFSVGAEDKTAPKEVKLKWKRPKHVTSRVYIGEGRSMKNPIVLKTKKKSVSVAGLKRATKYYWFVKYKKKGKVYKSKKTCFTTADVPRIMDISGVKNARDLGGYRVGARRTKQGMLYRSAKLDNIKKDGIKTIQNELGIKTELDLRKPGEGTAGTGSQAGIRYINISGTHYLGLWSTPEKREAIVKEMRILANPNNYPVLIHCTAGKDRTGTLAFLVNGMLGVSERDLLRDYELTYLTTQLGTTDRCIDLKNEFDEMYFYLKSYIDPTHTLQANITQYLLDSGLKQSEISAIKRIMLE